MRRFSTICFSLVLAAALLGGCSSGDFYIKTTIVSLPQAASSSTASAVSSAPTVADGSSKAASRASKPTASSKPQAAEASRLASKPQNNITRAQAFELYLAAVNKFHALTQTDFTYYGYYQRATGSQYKTYLDSHVKYIKSGGINALTREYTTNDDCPTTTCFLYQDGKNQYFKMDNNEVNVQPLDGITPADYDPFQIFHENYDNCLQYESGSDTGSTIQLVFTVNQNNLENFLNAKSLTPPVEFICSSTLPTLLTMNVQLDKATGHFLQISVQSGDIAKYYLAYDSSSKPYYKPLTFKAGFTITQHGPGQPVSIPKPSFVKD